MSEPTLQDTEKAIDRLWEASDYETRREDVATAYAAGVAAERERCAKVCEAEKLTEPVSSADDIAYNMAVNDCAAAIRKGETP